MRSFASKAEEVLAGFRWPYQEVGIAGQARAKVKGPSRIAAGAPELIEPSKSDPVL
jgi:hypothetical protein